MQAARDFVGAVIKLATGMQGGHDDFKRGALDLGMLVNRNARAVVRDADPTLAGDNDFHLGCSVGQGFVHTVVDDFVHKLMQPAGVGTADVHAGSTAYGFEALEHLDVLGRIRHSD